MILKQCGSVVNSLELQDSKLHATLTTFETPMATKNLALEFDSKTKTFSERESSIAGLEPGQVLIEVTCCTICGSDLHTFCGRRESPSACILGHEIIGRIVDWGGATIPVDFHGDQLAIGQRVTWAMAVGCGKCFYCLHGLGQKCETVFKYGHAQGDFRTPTGGLSQHCVLMANTPIFQISDSLPDEVACPANCATATVSAAIRLVSETHAIEQSTVVVFGSGMLGLTAAAQLKDLGAEHIVVCDVNVERLKQAKRFGASRCVDTSNPIHLESILSSITAGRGADIAMDFAGVLPAVESAVNAIRPGGCVLLAGSVFGTNPLSISPESIVRRMMTIRGLHNYLPSDLAQGLAFLERTHQQFPFKKLVSKTFELPDSQKAFEYARDHHPIRTAVRAQS